MNYLRDLHKAHRIEVSGEAVYAAAARMTRWPERRRKWQALEKLETQTKCRLASVITQLGDVAKERRADAWLGRAVAGVLACLPWNAQMRAMRAIVVHAISFWEQLARENPQGDAPLHDYLIAHERAQLDFVQDELQGRGERSLDHVLGLLDA